MLLCTSLYLGRWLQSPVLVNKKKNIVQLASRVVTLFLDQASACFCLVLAGLTGSATYPSAAVHCHTGPFFPVVLKKITQPQIIFSTQRKKKSRDVFHRTGCAISISLSEAFLKVNWFLKLSMFDTSSWIFLSGFSVLSSACCIWCTYTCV